MNVILKAEKFLSISWISIYIQYSTITEVQKHGYARGIKRKPFQTWFYDVLFCGTRVYVNKKNCSYNLMQK